MIPSVFSVSLWRQTHAMGADYFRALEVAISAARAAGDVLRRAFHQPGGPKGVPGKAPADTEAEHVIRKKLLDAFPDWGYRGEETGSQSSADPDRHVWLVDPNDGTVSYQSGYRGTAVSIGLLRDGRPVLGVVYAFAAPDDNGDLIAWAEGCGTVRRNGEPLPPAKFPAALRADDVVLVSQAADRKPEVNALAFAPARFRAVPSIAYRLALVAAGEGVAAVSLNSPGGWDYGAGHALLRAVGGELVDQSGQPVTYSSPGKSQTVYCFGGAPRIVPELAQRNWKKVLDAAIEPRVEFDLAIPEPGRSIPDPGMLARAQGCLLGQLAGDALGGLVEFQAESQIAGRYPNGLRQLSDGGCWDTLAGQPTDDSEMALMLARSILQAGQYDAEAAARAYAFWYNSKPFDAGNTIQQALVGIPRGKIAPGAAAPAMRHAADTTSQANGSLMRISPLAVWGHSLAADKLASRARADAELTHPHAVCRDAAAVFTVSIAHAIATGAGPEQVYDHAVGWAKQQLCAAPVQRALQEAAIRPPADYQKAAGWVLTALQNAFYHLRNAPSLEEGVVRSVMAGGDTDTNAAIAGALLGAVFGRTAIPSQWQRMVLSCRPIKGLPNVKRPRPRPFWPVDALELAERLLCLKPS